MKIFITAITLLYCTQFNTAIAQEQNKYENIDKYVERLGTLSNLNIAVITDSITSVFASKPDKARAIYYWITHHIALDPKAIRTNDNSKSNDPAMVIQARKATPTGIALVFQEMASLADIRCLSVEGYTRNNIDQINEKPDELNHAWNVVQLAQTPSEWYYVDAAKGCGHLDKKEVTFIPEFTSELFFTDKQIFNFNHFPDNAAWQLGPGAKSLSEFFSLPVTYSAAYALQLASAEPVKGFLKIKNNAEVIFNLKVTNKATISSVELYITEDRKKGKPIPMNFTNTDGALRFSYIFREADQFPLTITINGNDILTYTMEVTE